MSVCGMIQQFALVTSLTILLAVIAISEAHANP
jgi:hypothetical protein